MDFKLRCVQLVLAYAARPSCTNCTCLYKPAHRLAAIGERRDRRITHAIEAETHTSQVTLQDQDEGAAMQWTVAVLRERDRRCTIIMRTSCAAYSHHVSYVVLHTNLNEQCTLKKKHHVANMSFKACCVRWWPINNKTQDGECLRR